MNYALNISSRRGRRLLIGGVAIAITALAAGTAAAQVGPPGGGSPQVTITPGDTLINSSDTAVTVSVIILWCSDKEMNDDTRSITFDDVDVSSRFTTSGTGANGCVYGAHSYGSVVVNRSNEGVHRLWASIENVDGYIGFGDATYTLRWPGYVPPTYAVQVAGPGVHTIDASSGPGRSTSFTVTNLGNRPATYNLATHCRGALTCTGASPASVLLDTTSAARSATVAATFTAGAAGDTGAITLIASNSRVSGDVDSSSVDVLMPASTPANAPGVVLAGAGDVLTRDRCLTISVGAGAAYECGDLRLVHALPAVRTRGTIRTPTLLYNSQHARPNPVVLADVTLSPGVALPQSVTACIKIGGYDRGCGTWPGSQWADAPSAPALASSMLSQSGMVIGSMAGIVDGDVGTTGWHTDNAGPGAYLQVDLGVPFAFSSVAVYALAAYSGLYDIRYSNDGVDWGTAETGFRPDSGWHSISWGSVGKHRFWRLVLTNTPGPGAWLTELTFGIADKPDAAAPVLISSMLSQSGMAIGSMAGIVDGDTTTVGWHTDNASPGAYLQLDLGRAYMLSTLGVWVADPYAGAYDVTYSDDASAWSTAATGFRPIGGWSAISWRSVGAHRYWRLVLTNTPGPGGWLRELSINPTQFSAPAPPTLNGGMISQAGMAIGSIDGIVDGDTTTVGWHTDNASAGAYLQLDLGAAYSVQTIGIWVATPSAGVYDVMYSNDGNVWATAATGYHPIPGWSAISWGPVGVHRYWRLVLTNTPGPGAWLRELSVDPAQITSAPAGTRRIAIAAADSTWSTGPVDYTVEVTASNSNQGPYTATGRLLVVNRAGSGFGAGWWLAGLEQLVTTTPTELLWIGGDGSARVYNAAGTNLWRATNVDRPDSLIWNGSTYVRRLPSGTQIEFNAAGQHVATRALAGPPTTFTYANGVLTEIDIPTVGASTAVHYSFSYFTDSVVVQLVTPTANRRATLLRSGETITGIRDPDGTLVQFGYAPASARITSHTDRLNHTTTFTYDAGLHLTGSTLSTFSAGNLVYAIQPVESRGLPGTVDGAAQPVDSAYTLLDGPRTDVADVTKFWLNPYGSPSRIRNADGRSTTVLFDAAWPALPREVRSLGGAISDAWYNARGLVDSTRVSNLRKAGDISPPTQYLWHPTLALPTQITGPGGDVTSYGYNADGTVQYVQLGNDPASRTYADYYDAASSWPGLYRASSVPGRSERDSVTYDNVLANPNAIRDRRGNWSYTDRDGLGRVSYVRVQPSAGVWRNDSTKYDLAGQVIRQVSFGAASQYAIHSTTLTGTDGQVPADTLVVETQYDNEGRPLRVARWALPNRIGVTDTSINTFEYDEAGRKVEEFQSGGGGTINFDYDAGGDVIQKQQGGHFTTYEYDVLGRVTRRISPRMTYPRTSCSTFIPDAAAADCAFSFPLTPRTGSLTIPGDTAVFVYDAVGNMIAANNRSARVSRGYSPGGLLMGDTLRVRIVAIDSAQGPLTSQFTSHVYGLRYGYDAAGRRDSLWHPDRLDPCAGACPAQRYVYDGPTGRLTSIVDVRGQAIGFQYNLAGQLWQVNYPGGVSEVTQYDPEGQPLTRSVGGPNAGTFIADTLTYDALGRVTTGRGLVVRDGSTLEIYNAYSSLGALVQNEIHPGFGTPHLEEFRSDALGNQYFSRREKIHLGGSDDDPAIRNSSYDGAGHLTHVQTPAGQSTDEDWFDYWYDTQGRTSFSGGTTVTDNNSSQYVRQEAHYYDGDGRLALFERHIGTLQQASLGNDPRAVDESYRYDALGRRVLVTASRTVEGTSCTVTGCESTVQRFVWDGDQLLYETRGPISSPEDDSPSGNAQNQSPVPTPYAYGRVGYTHAFGIDRPLGVLRINGDTLLAAIYPHANWRGLYETATVDNGGFLPNVYTAILWPGASATAYLGASTPTTGYQWYGSLIAEQADASGLMYRRNRYYDPLSGRFTQPDPIGIAGGLNVYGFAGGDPVNFSDPFGLQGCDRDHPEECTLADVWQNFLQGVGDAFAPGFGADAGPGWKTGMFAGLLAQALGARAPVGRGISSGFDAGGAAGESDAALSPSARRAIRSLENQIEKHVQKLEDYKANPDALDNQGILKNASPEVRQRIINGRIRHLENEIQNFRNQIQMLRNPNIT